MYLPIGAAALGIYFFSFLYFFLLILLTHLISIKILYFNSQAGDKLNLIASLLFFTFHTSFWFVLFNKILGAKGVFLYFVVFFIFTLGAINLVERLARHDWLPSKRVFKSYIYLILKVVAIFFLLILNLKVLY